MPVQDGRNRQYGTLEDIYYSLHNQDLLSKSFIVMIYVYNCLFVVLFLFIFIKY